MAHWLFLQLLINGVVAGSLYAILGISFAAIFAPTKIFHFAHASVYVYAGYFLYQFGVAWGWPLPLSIPAAMLAAGIMGVAIDRVVYAPLSRIGAGQMEVLLSSFGAFVVLQSLILLIWKSDPRTVDVPRVLKQGIPVGMLTFTTFQVIIVLTAAIVFLGALLFMRRSKVGKAIRAMENDEAGALMVGIPTQKVRIAAFFIGSLVVALASVLTVLDKGLEPTIGVNALLVAVIAMIVGGVGSLPGAALAGLLLGVVENLGIWKISSEWKSAITFGVLFLFIIFRPRGLFGHRTARYEGDA